MEHMLRDQLSPDHRQHSQPDRRRDQTAVPMGLHELSCEIRYNQPKERNGSHHCRCDADAEDNAQQKSSDCPIIVNAKVDRLVLSQGDHIQEHQILPQDPAQRRQQDGGKDNDTCIDIIKVRNQRRQQCIIRIGIHDADHGRLDTAEERREHRADEQYIENMTAHLFKQPAIDNRRRNSHHQQVHHKGKF